MATNRNRARADRSPSHTVQDAFAGQVAALEDQIDGVIGFSARHLDSGTSLAVNGAERFPMASTYKVPMAGLALSLVDAGSLTLAERVEITERHVAETGEIAQSVLHPGVALSVANLIELMLVQSNNNATDRVLELIGGPAAVTLWLSSIGVVDMRVDSSVNDLLGSFYGLPKGSPSMQGFLERYTTEEARERVNNALLPAFDDGLHDTATPDAMVALLRGLFGDQLLSESSRTFLNGVMTRCQTGAGRIKGLLPSATQVAHKTGTIGGTINDVGVITLPGDRGRLALAIYTKKSPISPYTKREFAIAQLSRSIFDYFAFADF